MKIHSTWWNDVPAGVVVPQGAVAACAGGAALNRLNVTLSAIVTTGTMGRRVEVALMRSRLSLIAVAALLGSIATPAIASHTSDRAPARHVPKYDVTITRTEY